MYRFYRFLEGLFYIPTSWFKEYPVDSPLKWRIYKFFDGLSFHFGYLAFKIKR